MLIPMPPNAKPVARILARDVEKPSPYEFKESGARKVMRCYARKCCPMGLHLDALSPCPENYNRFPCIGLDTDSISAFAHWWDEKVNAENIQEALDAIWG